MLGSAKSMRFTLTKVTRDKKDAFPKFSDAQVNQNEVSTYAELLRNRFVPTHVSGTQSIE